jgi:hypothetical protein
VREESERERVVGIRCVEVQGRETAWLCVIMLLD